MADGDVMGRQAMMAPAGAWITWAEDETGGESYIPHALSKRVRSVALLGKTADMFGYDLHRRAADGYMTGWRDARPAAASTTVVVQPAPADMQPFVVQGDLVMPNVTRYDQAQEFLSDYKRKSQMARGARGRG